MSSPPLGASRHIAASPVLRRIVLDWPGGPLLRHARPAFLGGSILLALLLRLLLAGFKDRVGAGENLLCRLLRDTGSS
jgi:hypothetical protein